MMHASIQATREVEVGGSQVWGPSGWSYYLYSQCEQTNCLRIEAGKTWVIGSISHRKVFLATLRILSIAELTTGYHRMPFSF
jgi:hypothetical protein